MTSVGQNWCAALTEPASALAFSCPRIVCVLSTAGRIERTSSFSGKARKRAKAGDPG